MGKKRRLSSTPSHKTNHFEKEKSRNHTFDDSVYERRDKDFEPDVNVEEEEKDEVGEARFRFYGALKGLTDKKTEDSTSESSLFDEEEHDEEDMFSDSQINIVQDKVRHELARKFLDPRDPNISFNSGLSGNKYGFDSSDRLDDSKLSSDGLTTKQSYVMKLFDRSVDLAQFDDATPLYPICRSWVANQPKKPWEKKKDIPPVPTWNIKEEDEEEEEPPKKKEEVDPKDVDMSEIEPSQIELKVIAKLPPPSFFVDVNAPSIRIPQPLPKYIDETNALLPDESKNLDELPTKEDLMGDHLGRWTLVKRSWLHASQKNEERYLKSRKLLQMMYNKSQK